LENLALHELTHVFQMESLERGFTKFAGYLAGEQFAGMVAGLLPKWYLEGQAVFNETYFSGSGRGRSASFLKQLKPISLEKVPMYSYDKLINGSYKDYVPSFYHSGYQVVASIMGSETGQEVLNSMLDYTAKYPFTINPTLISLKKTTGYSKQGLFDKSFSELHLTWSDDLELSGAQEYKPLVTGSKREYQGYHSPAFVADNKIVAVKTSLSLTPRIVLIDRADSSESLLHVPGAIYPYQISASNDKVVWVETVTDPRWDQRDYSIVKILDIKTKRVKKLTSKTRYLSASISSDGKYIAAIDNSVDNKNRVDLIDPLNGKIIASFPAPGNVYLQRPQWSVQNDRITFISLDKDGEGIMSLNLTGDGEWATLIESNRDDYQTAFMHGDTLFYVSSVSGVENGYMQLPGGQTLRLTNSRFGATDMALKDGEIWFSDYTYFGNKICNITLDSAQVVKVSQPTSLLIEKIVPQKELVSVSSVESTYNPKPYNKMANLFNLHSWFPAYVDLDEVTSDFSTIKPGATLLSQNLLSTVVSWIGYEYADQRHQLHSEATFSGKYPVFRTRVDYGATNSIKNVGDGGGYTIDHISPELLFTGSMSVPLFFSSGSYYRQVVPTFSAIYINRYILGSDFVDKGQTQLTGRLYFYNYRSMSVRDIYPRFGQFADVIHTFYPFDQELFGRATTIRSAFFFPGGIPNSGIRLRYETEFQKVEKFRLANSTKAPRGFSPDYYERVHYFSFDYAIPLFYPDVNFWSLLYLKRIRTNIFYDYSISGNAKRIADYSDERYNWDIVYSKGFELMADIHLFRIPYEIGAGVRGIWKQESSVPMFEAAFNIDIYGNQIGKRSRR